jgi:hypothetical protein
MTVRGVFRKSFGAGRSLTLFLSANFLAGATVGSSQTPQALHEMFESGQVFALRQAAEQGNPPIFYRGAVEASLNHIGAAQRDLHAVIRANPHSEDAYQAHDLLGNLYERNGMYHEALAEIQAAIVERPTAKDTQNALPLFRLLSNRPDMTVVRRKRSRLTRADGILPFRLNGRDDSFAFDTGASISVMSEREAAHLRLTPESVGTKLGDSSGNGLAGFRVVVARNFVIGGLHLRNVPFLVLPDTGEPFVEMPASKGNRGLIGLPVLIAMGTIRWQSEGDFEFGFPSTTVATQASNLLFHGTNPIVQVTTLDKKLNFSLDTGAVDTDINAAFVTAFPGVVSSGKRETHTITGFGGTRTYDSVLLPSIKIRVGGREVTLAPAHVFLANGVGGETPWAGNLGNDLLNQAHTITLDFNAMSLRLE